MKLFQLLLLVASVIFPSVADISLSGFQQIVGFPQACQDAYNHPISACDPYRDFGAGHTCSPACSIALEALQTSIQIACRGINVDPSSVMGHFFSSTGPQFVCSGVAYNVAQGDAAICSEESATAATSSRTSSATGTSTFSVTDITTTTHHAITHATSTSRSTSHEASSSPSPADSASSTIPTGESKTSTPSFLSTAANDGTATTFSSQSQRTSSSNPDNFGGGGSPFEVSANSASAIRGESRTLWLSIGMLMLGIGVMA